MHILVTAGNTQAPIDRVRCITNVFTGRTGTSIALRAWERGHAVTLFTSHPEVVVSLHGTSPSERWKQFSFRSFDDLRTLLTEQVPHAGFDAIVHCAAVSDYLVEGVYSNAQGMRLDQAGKIKSDAPELWLRLVRAPKLIDSIRRDWGFRGVLVKFKLEVGIADAQLLDVAERSRQQSAADLIVANTLEGTADWAYVGPIAQGYERVARRELPDRLLNAMELLHHGGTEGAEEETK